MSAPKVNPGGHIKGPAAKAPVVLQGAEEAVKAAPSSVVINISAEDVVTTNLKSGPGQEPTDPALKTVDQVIIEKVVLPLGTTIGGNSLAFGLASDNLFKEALTLGLRRPSDWTLRVTEDPDLIEFTHTSGRVIVDTIAHFNAFLRNK